MPYDTANDPYEVLKKGKYDYTKTILPALAGMVSGSALSAMKGNSPRQATINAMLGGVGGGAGAFGSSLEQQSTYNRELANMINQNLWKQKEYDQQQGRYATDDLLKNKKIQKLDKEIADVGKPDNSKLPGLGSINEYNAYKAMPQEEQKAYMQYVSDKGYNAIMGLTPEGNPIYAATRGNLGLQEKERGGIVGDIQPKVKPTLPATEARALSDKRSVLDEIGKVDKLYNTPSEGTETPQGRGWVGPAQGAMGWAREKVTGNIAPEQAEFYATLADLQNLELYTKSGAQINEAEFKRIMNALPSRYLPDNTYEARFNRWKGDFKNFVNRNIDAFESAGYRNIDKSGIEIPENIQTESRNDTRNDIRNDSNSNSNGGVKELGGKVYKNINGKWYEK